MIHQFTHTWGEGKYWVDEKEGRKALLGRGGNDTGQVLDYQAYRLGVRAIASNTNERTMIVGPLPKRVFCGNSILVLKQTTISDYLMGTLEIVFVQAVLNSFALDAYMRLVVTANINMFYIYQLPVPRLTAQDPEFSSIVERAARLICTTPEFDDLAREVGLKGQQDGVTDPEKRATLRAELDARVAHLYGLTEAEFEYILSTFPLVEEIVKTAALNEFKKQEEHAKALATDPIVVDTKRLIKEGESDAIEFKQTLEYVADKKEDTTPAEKAATQKAVVHSALKTICAFLNSKEGGTLLIGVHDAGYVVGIQADLDMLGKRSNVDGFELKLRNLMKSRFTPVPYSQVKTSYPIIDGKTVCRIDVTPDADIYHLDAEVYVRHGASTEKLSGVALTNWIKNRTQM
jgi:hypothetical protein